MCNWPSKPFPRATVPVASVPMALPRTTLPLAVLPRSGPKYAAVQPATHDLLGQAGRAEQGGQVNPRVHAHVLEHVHHFLGGHVAGRPGGVGASAKPAD